MSILRGETEPIPVNEVNEKYNRIKWRLKLAGYSVVVRGGGFRGISKYDFIVLKWLTKHPDFILITAGKNSTKKHKLRG